MDDKGFWKESNQLHDQVVGYFTNLLTSESIEEGMDILDSIPRRFTNAMNDTLLLPIMTEEDKKALFSIGDLKAPGLDGLHVVFCKRFWHLLGDDLIAEVLTPVNTCVIPEGWNDTTIVLFP